MAKIINVYGVKSNIGVSHFSRMLVGFLVNNGYDTAYCGHDELNVLTKNMQTVSASDLNDQKVMEGFDYVVCDRGVDFSVTSWESVNIVVSGVKPNEAAAERTTSQYKVCSDAVYVYSFVPERKKESMIVLPWNSEEILPGEQDETFLLIMNEVERRFSTREI